MRFPAFLFSTWVFSKGGAMDTLVLDTRFVPMARVPWTRAVTLAFTGKVEVLEEYADWTVRSVRISLRVPAVIRFLRNVFRGGRPVRFSRENVYARDGGRCQYCGVRVARSEATIDHVLPRGQGGRTHWENVVVACLPCNQQKGGRTPAQAGMRLWATPFQPRSISELLRVYWNGASD
jgi:5-methylcytosine-specific restriction endonuclease McrA